MDIGTRQIRFMVEKSLLVAKIIFGFEGPKSVNHLTEKCSLMNHKGVYLKQ